MNIGNVGWKCQKKLEKNIENVGQNFEKKNIDKVKINQNS